MAKRIIILSFSTCLFLLIISKPIALGNNATTPSLSFFSKKFHQLQTVTIEEVKNIIITNQLPQKNYFVQDKKAQLHKHVPFLDLDMPSSSVCPDIEIIDLRNVAGFAQLNDLTICGATDTLSFMVFTGDPGEVKGFELTLDLPDGIEYAGWEFVQLGNTSIIATNSNSTKPEFYIDGITGDSLVIANIGLKATCDVNKSKSLFIDFDYKFVFIDTADVIHKCSNTFQPTLELNSAVHEPVLNLLSPLSPAEVTISSVAGTSCQELQISQDGLNSYVDSLSFEIIGLDFNEGDLLLDSIVANDIKIPTANINFDLASLTTKTVIDGSYFFGNALANPADNQMNTDEILTIEVCYSIAQCPSITQLPFQYRASFGCNEQVCQQSTQSSALSIQPNGALMPTATVSLNTEGAEICGSPAMVSLTMDNPNADTDATVYEDLTLGFQTCAKPNLDVTGVIVNGISLPDSLYSWVGDDINIDFTKNTLTTLGLTDYDNDGFYDDVQGGNSVTAIVEIGVTCGINLSQDCVNINCKDVQFYVDAKTNCGNTFKDFPTPDMFNLVYGTDTVYNPTEVQFGTTGVYGYDFGTYSDNTDTISTDSSALEVIFCYAFEKENIEDCTSGATNSLEVLFSGDPKFSKDLQFVPNSDSLSIDGGVSYTAINSATMTKPDDNSALLILNGGSDAANVCYKYSITMDSCLCSPVGYFTAQQQVVSSCSDCSGGCEILKACRSTTFRADPDCKNCDCIVQNRHVRTERANLGYTDKTMTTKHTRESLINAGGAVDLTRFVPGDTLLHQSQFVILDTLALQNLSDWRITFNYFENGSTSWTALEKLELTMDAHNAILDEFSLSKVGGSGKVNLDLASLANCQTDNMTNFGGVWNYFDKSPFGNAIDNVENHNSSSDYADNNQLRLYLWNYDKVEDCGGDNAHFTGGNCLEELITTYSIAVGDTINFTWRAPLIKNPNRAALEALGIAPVATNVARIYPSFSVYEHDPIAGSAAYCDTYVAGACVEFSPIYLDCPGDVDVVTRMDLTDCGGTVTHEFTVNELAGPIGNPWFTKEFRPLMNIKEVDAMIRAPLAYCANAQVEKIGVLYDVSVDSTINMFCNPVPGYDENLCAVDTVDMENVGKVVFNLFEQGVPALGIGLDNCDTLRLSYDLCMVCPGDIVDISTYNLVYDWAFVGAEVTKNTINHVQYRCNHEDRESFSICDEYGFEVNDFYWELLAFDSLMNKNDRSSAVFILNDNRDPLDPMAIDNLGANLLASESPGVSEEIQRIEICNSDVDDTAIGVGASITVPVSVSLVNIYADTMGTPSTLTTNLISDDGIHKTYQIILDNSTLAPNACDTFYVGTSLLYCPNEGDPQPKICVGTFSGCASNEVKAALAASNGCGESEICYAYTSGEVGLQSEWFDLPINPALCDTAIFNVRVKNVKQLTLLNVVPSFELPAGMTPLANSWEVAYPGGDVAPLNWMPIGTSPDVIIGNTYSYSDDGLWSNKINTDGLQGVSAANATLDSNKVAFRFKAISNCDEFLSGGKLITESTAADPCTDNLITSGFVESPGVIINGANPIDYAQLLLVSDPEVLNCMGTDNSFGITAINTGTKSTSDSVRMCITLPEELTYTDGSLMFTSPADFMVGNIIQTSIGPKVEICFDAPKVTAYGAFSVNFSAAMKDDAECGDIKIGTDIKSFVDGVTCAPGPPSNCGVFVQNSLNNSVNIELNPPFITEDLALFTDCDNDADSVKLYYEYTINHNGPDAINQAYTANFYEDFDANQMVNPNVDILLGNQSGTFSVSDGNTITISGEVTVPIDKSCPILFEVAYNTSCACDRSSQYFSTIPSKALRAYEEPLTMCVGSCFDIDICDFVSVKGDSIIGATGIPYTLDIDWVGLDNYGLPLPGLSLDSTDYASMTDNSIGNGNRNLLVSEGSYGGSNGWLVATYTQPVTVSKVFTGGGFITGWGNATQIPVYKSTAYCLEYSHDGINWTDSGLSFTGADGHYIEENILPTPIGAQYWRMGSCNSPTNWATSEFRLEGEGLPFQNSPISQTGNTVTICLPEGVGIDTPWEIEFNTGTGECTNTEIIEIWKTGTPAFTIEGDTFTCGSECIDMEVIIPNDANAGMTIAWTPAGLVDDPTAFEIEACNLTTDVTFEATITYNNGACQESIQFPVKHYPINTINITGDTVACYNQLYPPQLTADTGWDLYTWYDISSGEEVIAYSSFTNTFIPLEGGDYIVKASQAGTTCPAISTTAVIPTTICLFDYGDLPDSGSGTSADNYETSQLNNGPSHVITDDLFLGPTVDDETDGQPSGNADGDGNDEDGVIILSSMDLSPGTTFRLPLSVHNTSGKLAHIEAWIDWNGDGAFDPLTEMVTNISSMVSFQSFLTLTVPLDAKQGSLLGFRLRLSHRDNMTPYGQVDSGEIEDYLLGVNCPQVHCLPINTEVIREK